MKALYICIFIFISTMYPHAEQVNIVFRYDDITLRDDITNNKILQLFLSHNIPLVLGVIPYNASEHPIIDNKSYFLASVKKAVGKSQIEIALHGMNHQRITQNGEFSGLSIAEQTRRIQKGKHLLDSVFNYSIVTFIPPWNDHDNNTVKALNLHNITILSSSIYDIGNETTFYPMSTADFRDIKHLITNKQHLDGIGIVMMHRYDFTNKESFKELDKTLSLLHKNPSFHVCTFRELQQKKILLNACQTEDLKHQNLLSKFVHPKGIFISPEKITLINSLNSIAYLTFFYLIYLVLHFLLPQKHRHNSIQFLSLVLSGLLVFFSVWFYWSGPLKLVLYTILLAIILALTFRISNLYNFNH